MAQLLHLTGRAVTDANGNPYPAAVAHFYLPGTTTNVDTYTTAGLSVANANPVVSDASTGIFGAIYLAAKRYKVVIKDASANTLQTWEVVDATEQLIVSASAPSPTYPLLRYANTSDGHTYRRNLADSGWVDEGLTDSLLNASSVTEQLAATATDKSSTPDSVGALWQRGTNITPSGGTVSLPSTGGGVFNVAAGNFSAISSAVGGRPITMVHGGASVMTHNATSLILQGGANITTEAGDVSEWKNEAATDVSGANWRMTNWFPNEGRLIAVATQAMMEAQTNNEMPVTPVAVNWHPGVAKFWLKATANSTTIEASHNVTSVADTATGRMTVTIATDMSGADWCCIVGVEKIAGAGAQTGTVESGGQAAGTVIMECRDNAGSLSDPVTWHCVGYGDQ